MARPIRRTLKFDEDSANKLLQEIYNESFNIKAKLTRLFTKWEIKVKEGGEIQAIGDQIVKIIAAEAKNQDQKIMLLKYLKDVAFEIKGNNSNNNVNNGNSSSDSEEDSGVMTTERRMALMSMVEEQLNKKEENRKK